MSIDHPVRIGSMKLETPFIASSSSATSRLEDLQQLNRTAIGAITVKSATLLAREGNPECNYYSDNSLSFNAKGLPGPDLDGTMKMLETFNAERKKPIILSVAGMKPEEYIQLIRDTRKSLGVLFDAYELNLSCPNVEGKAIVGYDHQTTREIIEEILTENPKLPAGVKTPPFFDAEEQKNIANEIQKYLDSQNPGWKIEFDNNTFYDRDHLMKMARTFNILAKRGLQFVTATNTFPNCRIRRTDGSTVINPAANQGRAGLSGAFIHDISVENVRVLHENLDSHIPIIGTGGVKNKETAENFLLAGAKAVGLGTALIDRSPKLIQEIILS